MKWYHFFNFQITDIIYNGYPYNTNPIEHHLGLVFANDTVKPGYEYYVSFANDIIKGAVPIPPSPSSSVIGIYWPSEVCHLHSGFFFSSLYLRNKYYFRDTINNPGNNAGDSSRRALILYPLYYNTTKLFTLIIFTFHLLTLLQLEVVVVREDQLSTTNVKVTSLLKINLWKSFITPVIDPNHSLLCTQLF